MIKCPKCNATLPDGSGYCQFCKATFVPLDPLPKAAKDDDTGIAPQPNWVWPAYRGISIWWIVSGLYGVVSSLLTAGEAGPNVLFIALEGLTAIIGIGLIFNVGFIRKLVNIVCFLQILGGVLSVAVVIFSPHIKGILGLIALLIQALDIAFAVLMIYLLGETETQAPNF